MALTGDNEKLIRLVSQLDSVGEVPKEARAHLASIALHRVLVGFSRSREPMGTAWKPLLYRKGGRPLVDTGKLRGSLRARVTSDGFEISTSVPYAKHHQFGAPKANVPARPFLPREGELPPSWRAAFERVIDHALVMHFR